MGEIASGNIILTGFSYSGKTVVGQEVARRLGWSFVDTDEEVVRLAGKPIPDIFSQDGEERFRALERQVLEQACGQKKVVIAIGGGAILDPDNRQVMSASGVVICLEAMPQTIHKRLVKDARDSGNPVVRPLLASPNPLERIRWLKEHRQPCYDLADWKVATDEQAVTEVSEAVIRHWHKGRQTPEAPSRQALRESDAPYCEEHGAAAVVTTASASYPIFVGWGILPHLGKRMRNAGLSGSAIIVSDDQVLPRYGDKVRDSLTEAGFAVDSLAVPQGEGSKSIAGLLEVYDFLVASRVERGHAIVALGGGMVGDLAGFAAATFLRGLPLVQVPTTLVAMADSAIGGKVAINHPRAKNLIGAFYQPRLVVADIQLLTSLPSRELASGWAEVIKHALILDPGLLHLLEENCQRLLELEPEVTTEAIVGSAALKARVVSEDEREQGIRTLLNYGHTIAHGLEAATDYTGLLHGEAVAIGMMGAALVSHKLGLLSPEVIERHRALLQRFGLPTTAPAVDPRRVLQAMELDKKVRHKAIRWVLLADVGEAIIRDDVPQEVAASAVQELTAA